MQVLIVYAHPEPKSLNGLLKDHARATLEAAGHAVAISDLYAMGWKAAADGGDSLDFAAGERLDYPRVTGKAFRAGRLAEDIAAEQQKLLAADAVIFQFPLWWFGMPAILKGWIDRVFTPGFAYGIRRPDNRWGGKRYGDEGGLSGRRAMLSVTVGGLDTHYERTGINGAIDDLLFPITHGMLFYAGLRTLPSFVVYDALRRTNHDGMLTALENRLNTLWTDDPIPYRAQNEGDYDDNLKLRDDLAHQAPGLDVHKRQITSKRQVR